MGFEEGAVVGEGRGGWRNMGHGGVGEVKEGEETEYGCT